MKALITGAANGIGARLDVRNADAWAALLHAHPDVDVVCNVAGVLRPG